MKYFNKIIKFDCYKILKNIDIKQFKNKKVLILGSNGFLASIIQSVLITSNKINRSNCKIISVSQSQPYGILKDLISTSKDIKFIKKDLSQTDNLKFLNKYKFDFIFHCATYGQPSKWMQQGIKTISLNTESLKYLLDKSTKDNSKIMFFSSVDVYGELKNKKAPVDENFQPQFKNMNRIPYKFSKLLGEELCSLYKKEFNTKVYVIRAAHTYGPGQGLNDKRAICDFLRGAIFKKVIKLKDKGKSIKTWGYVSDIVTMFFNIITNGKNLTYNTVGSDYQSIYKVAKTICNSLPKVKLILPKKNIINFKFGKDPKYQIFKAKNYNKEFKKTLQIGIHEGVQRLVDWNLITLGK